MRTGVDQAMAVRRTDTEVAALGRRDGGHGGAGTNLDAVPLALAQAAEDTRDHVVGLVRGVDRAVDSGHPHSHPEVLEEGESETE